MADLPVWCGCGCGPRTARGARILDQVIVKDDSVGAVERVVGVDSSAVRAHQHAGGVRKKEATAYHQAEVTIAAIVLRL